MVKSRGGLGGGGGGEEEKEEEEEEEEDVRSSKIGREHYLVHIRGHWSCGGKAVQESVRGDRSCGGKAM